MTAVEALQAGRDRLMSGKWHPSPDLNPPPGHDCMVTALTLTNSGQQKYAFLLTAVEQLFPERWDHSLYGFNKHPDTTFQDVIDVYDAAILLAKEAE